jgi:hypothetical protein
MVNYKCPTCSKEFKKKCHYIVHTEQKKKPCSPTVPKNSELFQTNSENSGIFQNSQTNIDIEKEEEVKKISCPNCYKSFSTNFNLNKHVKHNCKVLKLEKEEYDKKIELLTKNTIEIEELKKQLNNLTKELEKQKEKAYTQNINKGNIINNHNNIIIPQHKLCDFGTEDLEKIDPKKILKVLELSGVHSLIGCLNNIHNNDDLPQYKNVFITDKSRDKALIWTDNEWKVRSINRVVSDTVHQIEQYSRIIEKRIKGGKYKNMKDPDDPKKTLDTQTILENYNNRLKKYINRYYDGDEDVDEKQTKEFQKMTAKNIQNELFNYKNKVCNNFYKILDEIEKTQDDKELKEANQFTKNKIEELKKLIEEQTKEDIKENDTEDIQANKDNQDNLGIQDNKEPVYVLKDVVLASGLVKKKWLRADEEYKYF